MRREDFRRFVEQNLDVGMIASEERRRAWTRVVNRVATAVEAIADEGASNDQTGDASKREGVLSQIPRWIGEAFADLGWQWNGYYVRKGDALHLGHAHGPPVCTPLERKGELFSSGMCWDAVLTGQSLAMRSDRPWPGYVSCDGPSGLTTVAGIVCPLRAPDGRVIGVWDLDATQALDAADPRCAEVLFASLGACLAIDPAGLGAA